MKLGKLLTGLGIGVIAGMLLAPKKGSELREDIKNESLKVYNTAKNMTKEDAQALLNQTIDTIKKSVDEFDTEEFKNMAVAKFNELTTKEPKIADEQITQSVEISHEAAQKIVENLYHKPTYRKPDFKAIAKQHLKDKDEETL